MSAIVYPSALPAPVAALLQPAERRLGTELAGPRAVRGIQRDYLGTQRVEFVYSNAQAAVFGEWFRDDLVHGGAWFAANWPTQEGWHASAVRRFMAPPSWQLVAGYGWRVSAECEVRGRGLPPVRPATPLAWNESASSALWSITDAEASINHYKFPPDRQMLYADRYQSAGRRYFEIYVDDRSSSQAGYVIGKLGITQAGYASHWHSYINGTGGPEENDLYGEGDPASLPNAYRPTWGAACVIQVAVDLDEGKMWLGKNGSWGVGSPVPDPALGVRPAFSGITGPVTPFVRYFAIISLASVSLRTTGAAFDFTPPSGFVAFAD